MQLSVCLCWLCTPCRAPALSDSEQPERDYGSWLRRWVCWEEESNSLIYLGHCMVSSLSATAGCEQSQLQLLADGFCKNQRSSPAPSTGEAEQGWASCASVEGSGGLLIKFLQCSVIRNSVFESLLGGFSTVLSLFISTGKDGAVVQQGFAGEKRKPDGNSCSGLWQPCSELGLRVGVASGCVPEITYELMSQKSPETCRLAFLLPVQTGSCSTEGHCDYCRAVQVTQEELILIPFFLLRFLFFAVIPFFCCVIQY